MQVHQAKELATSSEFLQMELQVVKNELAEAKAMLEAEQMARKEDILQKNTEIEVCITVCFWSGVFLSLRISFDGSTSFM